MGCCASKIPTFPHKSSSSNILLQFQQLYGHDHEFNIFHIVPQTGMTALNIAVYKDDDKNDYEPAYFFGPNAGQFKLYKIESGLNGNDDEKTKTEIAAIGQGWQSSQGYTQSDHFNNHETSVTTSAKKTLTVKTTDNGIETKVKVAKKFGGGLGIVVELDSGYELKKNNDGIEFDLTRDGMVVAKMFDPLPTDLQQQSNPMALLKVLQRPALILIKSHLSENEMIQVLTIVATASDRLIRTAQLDISSGFTGGNNGYDNRNYHHNDYNNNNNHYNHDYGGGDEYDYGGGGGGGDDYGGGGGDYGGGGGEE